MTINYSPNCGCHISSLDIPKLLVHAAHNLRVTKKLHTTAKHTLYTPLSNVKIYLITTLDIAAM